MSSDSSSGGFSLDGSRGSDGDEFVASKWTPCNSATPRPELTRELVDEVLRRYVNDAWSLRAGQFEVVAALWRGSDVVCTFPTSAGKTLIMMLGPLLDSHYLTASVWVVCQPLEALRKTSVAKVKAEYFAKSDVSLFLWGDEVSCDFDVPTEGVGVIFCSPEQLEEVQLHLSHHRAAVRGLLVDEVHLRFSWEFRDYTPSDRFSSSFQNAVIGVFSATLDRIRSEEVMRLMGMRNVAFFTEYEFPHLQAMKLARWDQFCVRSFNSDPDRLVTALVELFAKLAANQSVIVFASSYAKLARLVEPLGRDVLRRFGPRMYCASYPQVHKDATCDLLKSGRCRLVGATCALGAGVDLPNIGAVVFFGCPKSFNDATQGMGRAGRGPGAPLVEVIFAVDSNSISKAENKMRLLLEYCAEAKSKFVVECSLCQERRYRPVSGAAECFKMCFDFESVHCARPTRPACRRTICKVFDGLLSDKALFDAALDCGLCDSCAPLKQNIGVGMLVKYNRLEAVVLGFTDTGRCRIQETGNGTPHAVVVSSLSLVSTEQQEYPAVLAKNKLNKRQKKALVSVLTERFRAYSLERNCLISCAPGDVAIVKMAKWSSTTFAERCPVTLVGVDLVQWFDSAQAEAKVRAEADAKGDAGQLGSVPGSAQYFASLRKFIDTNIGPVRVQMAANERRDREEQEKRKKERDGEDTGVATRQSKSLGGDNVFPTEARGMKRRSTFSGK